MSKYKYVFSEKRIIVLFALEIVMIALVLGFLFHHLYHKGEISLSGRVVSGCGNYIYEVELNPNVGYKDWMGRQEDVVIAVTKDTIITNNEGNTISRSEADVVLFNGMSEDITFSYSSKGNKKTGYPIEVLTLQLP